MEKKKFIISSIAGVNFLLSKDESLSLLGDIINKAHKDRTQVIFVVSVLAETTKILNALFDLWDQEGERSKFCVFEYFKKFHKRISIKFQLEEEISTLLEKYFKEISFLLNKKIRSKNKTKDLAQIQVYGELIYSLILFGLIRKNFPTRKCFLGDSRNIIKINPRARPSYMKAQANSKTSSEDMRIFFHIKEADVFILQNSIACYENGSDVILRKDLFNIYRLACSRLGKVKII
jgi:aspartokinase